jgi:hypothetical protein
VGNVVSMSNMFLGTTSFNQDIGYWDVSKVTQMDYMFYQAKSFNQDIGSWNVSNVKYTIYMFYQADSFNQAIGSWDVSNVIDMYGMFSGASSFDQDLGNWKLNPEVNLEYMLIYCGMSCENYDKTLIGWSKNPEIPENRTLHANNLTYWQAKDARDMLINEKGWTIYNDNYSECNYQTSVENAHRDEHLLIYPNPVTDILNISNYDSGHADIIDCQGRIAKSIEFKGSGIDISGLPMGIYCIIIRDNNRQIIEKFIKI